jgi:hypothetical protein
MEGSGNEVSLSLWELWDRNLKEGLLYWGCWRICKRRLWKGPSLSIQAPLGNWRGERGLVYQGLWKADIEGLWKQSVYLCGSSTKGTWREGFFTGNPESYVRRVKEGFGNGYLSLYRGSVRGTSREGSYTEDSDRQVMEGSGNRAFVL